MLKPEQVPTCVAEKLRRMVYDFETNEYVLIAAAINAWPGMTHTTQLHKRTPSFETIILPLPPQETRDE